MAGSIIYSASERGLTNVDDLKKLLLERTLLSL